MASQTKNTKSSPRFMLRRPEHFDECMICDATDDTSLRGAVAVEFRPDDSPHLAAIYCRACVENLARVAQGSSRSATADALPSGSGTGSAGSR